jgi:hypothetical protein
MPGINLTHPPILGEGQGWGIWSILLRIIKFGVSHISIMDLIGVTNSAIMTFVLSADDK